MRYYSGGTVHALERSQGALPAAPAVDRRVDTEADQGAEGDREDRGEGSTESHDVALTGGLAERFEAQRTRDQRPERREHHHDRRRGPLDPRPQAPRRHPPKRPAPAPDR